MTRKISRLALGVLIIFTTAFASPVGIGAKNIPEGMPQASAEENKELTISLRLPTSSTVEQVPLFSGKHAQAPVAMVNGEPITLEEFADQLVAMHSDMGETGSREKTDFIALLDRMIGVKLVVQEAENIGFDQTQEVRKQLEDFALKTMITQLIKKQLRNLEPDQEKVEELYRKMALEARLATYKFQNQTDAQALLDKYKAGEDFQQAAGSMVESGKAETASDSEYIKLKDLLPSVAQEVFQMDIGGVSEIFKADNGYLLFKLEDRRGYDDPEARTQAVQMVLQQQAKERQEQYLKELEAKYVVIDKEAEASLDFEKIMKENPETKASEIFQRLRSDQRPLATIRNNGETSVITVAEIVKKLEASFYHGTDKPIVPQEVQPKKESIIQDTLIKIIGAMEAKNQGIETSAEYLKAVAKFREKLLFDTFMNRAVLPGVKVSQEEARDFYQVNIAEYSTPLMLKLKSLAFTDEKSAQDALKKLQAGSDFKWVSANVTGLAPEDDKNLLNFGGSLLSVTALPDDLQKMVSDARSGSMFFYEDPGKLFYVLVVENAFPPEAKPYDEVQNEAARGVYGKKIRESLDVWVEKLKEAYDTEIFLVRD